MPAKIVAKLASTCFTWNTLTGSFIGNWWTKGLNVIFCGSRCWKWTTLVQLAFVLAGHKVRTALHSSDCLQHPNSNGDIITDFWWVVLILFNCLDNTKKTRLLRATQTRSKTFKLTVQTPHFRDLSSMEPVIKSQTLRWEICNLLRHQGNETAINPLGVLHIYLGCIFLLTTAGRKL